MDPKTMDGWRIQRVSELSPRDGFGVELLDPEGTMVADVFASDGEDAAFTVSTHSVDVPVLVMEWFLRCARTEIAHYTDGRPLPT